MSSSWSTFIQKKKLFVVVVATGRWHLSNTGQKWMRNAYIRRQHILLHIICCNSPNVPFPCARHWPSHKQALHYHVLKFLWSIKVIFSLFTPWRRVWGVEVGLHSFLTSELGGGEWLTWRPGRFTLSKKNKWMIGWVSIWTFCRFQESDPEPRTVHSAF